MPTNPVAMTADEQATFLNEPGMSLQLATIGANGYPHLSAMWYVFTRGHLYFNTYGASQKGRNIARDPRVSCMVEAGKWYGELRGVVLQGKVVQVTEQQELDEVGLALIRRYPLPSPDITAAQLFAKTRINTRRQVYRLEAEHVYSWDHRKTAARQKRKSEGASETYRA
jgi:PPOX class probable F420-dependent enzyme